MDHLIEIRTNILYAKQEKKAPDEPDVYQRFNELVFLVDKPFYEYTNEGKVIRQRCVGEVKFTVSQKNFDIMLAQLTALRDSSEKDFE